MGFGYAIEVGVSERGARKRKSRGRRARRTYCEVPLRLVVLPLQQIRRRPVRLPVVERAMVPKRQRQDLEVRDFLRVVRARPERVLLREWRVGREKGRDMGRGGHDAGLGALEGEGARARFDKGGKLADGVEGGGFDAVERVSVAARKSED